ncbi:hypothetical protein [Streptomyces sp. NBC_00467]|uniref:hypothetical protein n=1 Tax=Streptomyces sp. NBC_00467 TaxID=2975752 RepID=UPI002E19C5BC
MGLRAIVTFDAPTGGGAGNGLVSWYDAALTGPLKDLVEQEPRGGAYSAAETHADERAERMDFGLVSTGWNAMRQELLREPETAFVTLWSESLETPAAHVRSSSISVRRPNMGGRLLLGDALGSPDDPAYCDGAVAFLVAALDAVNPAFAWLGDDGPATDDTHLDCVLGRKVRDSVREARTFLRGYSWTTVCPEELSQRLGGPKALAATGAFHRIVPLTAGGVVLQATRTVADYTDDAVRRVVDALRPVLPPGMPQFDPARGLRPRSEPAWRPPRQAAGPSIA